MIDLIQNAVIVALFLWCIQLSRIVVHQKQLIDLSFDSADIAYERGKINSNSIDKVLDAMAKNNTIIKETLKHD